jgi:hypothetical protein
LTASTVDTVTFDYHVPEVEVINLNGAGLYFTVDGSTPTVAGRTRPGPPRRCRL